MGERRARSRGACEHPLHRARRCSRIRQGPWRAASWVLPSCPKLGYIGWPPRRGVGSLLLQCRNSMPSRRFRVLCAGLLLAACAIPPKTVTPAGLHSPFTGYSSALYRDDKMWLCRPDIRGDICHADATATEVRPDGSRVLLPSAPPPAAKVDCFYVYPTVDMGLVPANHSDIEDIAAGRGRDAEPGGPVSRRLRALRPALSPDHDGHLRLLDRGRGAGAPRSPSPT